MVACGTGRTRETGSTGAAVRPGIEVLLRDSMHLVRGKRVGLVTNQTGIDSHGASDVDVMVARDVRLVALFSPEHGFRGAADPGAAIGFARDSATGLPIYSLYGRTVAPTDSMLDGIDVMIVDLQDVGARYYTYISTAIEVMRASARRGLGVIILDRPNPIGGAVQGAVLDTAYASFVGRLRVPMRHGLTMGELARLANAELAIGASLTVIPVEGWARAAYFDATGLPFVPPSPNLRSLESLIHYPGTCLFEGTNLSVGRGSNAPFEQIGAPWLDADDVLKRLRGAGRNGVVFEPVSFTPARPGDGKYADTTLAGIRLRVTDRSRYDPTVTAVYLLAAIRGAHRARLEFVPRHFDRLAGSSALRVGLERGDSAAGLVAGWDRARAEFLERAGGHLLYR